MALTRANVECGYLDVSNLEVGLEARKRAYLLDAAFKYDKNGDPYFVYTFKDCNKAKIVGRQFKVEDAINKSAEIIAMKGKIVEIAFITRVWNKSLNLVIDGIYESDGDTEVFLTSVAKLDAYTKTLEEQMTKWLKREYSIPFYFSVSCIPEVCNGELGGYVKLLTGAFNNLISFNGIPGIDMQKLLEVFARVQSPYLDYLTLKASSESVASINILDIIFKSRSPVDDGYNEIVSDCLSALCGLAKPTHVYAFLVSDAINNHLFNLKVAYDIPLMAKGFTQMEGELSLTNY